MSANEPMTLLFLGAGLVLAAFVIGISAGIIGSVKSTIPKFKYGSFYVTFSLPFSVLYFLATMAFYYQFLGSEIALYCSIVSLALLISAVLIFMFLPLGSRLQFTLLSLPCLFFWPLIPLFIWNLVYIFAVYKPGKAMQSSPPDLPTSHA